MSKRNKIRHEILWFGMNIVAVAYPLNYSDKEKKQLHTHTEKTQHNIFVSGVLTHFLSTVCPHKFLFLWEKRRSVINMAYLPRRNERMIGEERRIYNYTRRILFIWKGHYFFETFRRDVRRTSDLFSGLCITWAIFLPS